jgi:DNA polymerase-3 subunit epsilon
VSLGEFLRLRLRRAPPRPRLVPHTSLERLTFMAIDSETTGLDPRRDRIVAFAAVAIRPGLEVDPKPVLDLLIDPGIPIPPRATAVHGIDNRSVGTAPCIADRLAGIDVLLNDSVVVGHHVGYDLALLAAEAARARRPWREPPSLDTAQLLGGLGRRVDGIDLADLLTREGIERRGRRHSAVGDALMAADLFVTLARRLIGQGRGTFSGAVALQRVPRH